MFIQTKPSEEHGKNRNEIVKEEGAADWPMAKNVVPNAEADDGAGEYAEYLPSDEVGL